MASISVYTPNQHEQLSLPDGGLAFVVSTHADGHVLASDPRLIDPLADVFMELRRTADSFVPGPLPAQRIDRGEARVRGDEFLSAARLKSRNDQFEIKTSRRPIDFLDGISLNSDESCGIEWMPINLTGDHRYPIQFRIGEYGFCLSRQDRQLCEHESLRSVGQRERRHVVDFAGRAPSADTLSQWFEALGSLQGTAANSHHFFNEASRAVVSPGGMESGMILVRSGDDWRIAASHVSSPPVAISYDLHLLNRVATERRTFYHSSSQIKRKKLSPPIVSVVAAPILDHRNEVCGVVYGSRELHSGNQRTGIRKLEAQWIHLIAEAVSSGVCRLHREAEAVRSLVLLERAFPPQVSSALLQNLEILEAQSRELTILFADLRGFSNISERVGAKQTFRLLTDVMNRMTSCVLEQEGAIIDYYGDGLAAMWNAPTDQPDHAKRACQAALEMQREISKLNLVWSEEIGQPLRMGIGINTGEAQVGNAGSNKRLKYGPRGPNVNLASRIESATKRLKTPILISKSTLNQLPKGSITRKVGSVRLSGISQTVDVYEWAAFEGTEVESELLRRFDDYERVLALAESGDVERLQDLVTNLGLSCSVDVQSDDSKQGHHQVILDLTGSV